MYFLSKQFIQTYSCSTIVFTAVQTLAFFTNADQMVILVPTMLSLNNEGITMVADLLEFDEKTIGKIAATFRHVLGGPVVFGAKLQKQLTVAANAVRYYKTVGRALMPEMMSRTPVLKNFEIQHKTL